MLLKILGSLDLTCGIILILLGLGVALPSLIILFAGLYLVAKILVFILSFDIGCAIDLTAALCLFLGMAVSIPSWILYIPALAIIVKGFLSVVA